MIQHFIISFRNLRRAVALSAALLLTATSACGGTLFVKPTGNDTQSGASWALAKQTIPGAIAAALAGDQLWVASGTYTQLVTLKPGVAMYGGFNGTETSFSQRNLGLNFAILDGRSQGIVVTVTNAGTDTRVDGFIITGGSGINGAGIFIDVAAPTIIYNTIIRNTTSGGAGAGIFINGYLVVSNAQPVILDNFISQNFSRGANGDAGGIAISGASPLIGYNRVLGNFAGRFCGGIGCWKDCHAILVDNVIEGNAASLESSIGVGGGVFATASDLNGNFIQGAISAPVITDNVIAANGAPAGAGIALIDSNTGSASVINNTIVANTGSGVYWGGASPSNCNNVVAFNSVGFEQFDISASAVKNNDVFGNTVLGGKTDFVGLPNPTGANGNISIDPKFANFRIGNFHLQSGSPCIDAGLNSAAVTGYPDADLNTRIVGAAVDIGAYESTGATLSAPTPIIYVSPAGNDGNNGLSWVAAKKTIQAGIGAANPLGLLGGEVWVAQGTYSERIVLPAFVYAYGGFAGNETTRTGRNISAHPAVIDGGGTPTVVLSQSAGYLVSTLDGFTVQNGGSFTAGVHPGPSRPQSLGGGINCTVSSPIIANNLIVSNSIANPYGGSQSFGAGIYCTLSAPQIIGNTFYKNEELDNGSGSGGGIYVTSSKPIIQGNLFLQNYAKYGSAISAFVSSVNIISNTVQNNTYYQDGMLYFGPLDGAIFLTSCSNFLIEANSVQANVGSTGAGIDIQISGNGQIRNNLVVSNSIYYNSISGGAGGALYCDSIGNIQILNNTIVGNTGAGLYNGSVLAQAFANNAVVLANNIVAFNASGITKGVNSSSPLILFNNCVTNPMNYAGLSAGSGDINVDPQFVNPYAANYHLLATSPCIDSGYTPNVAFADFEGVPRPLDGNNDSVAAFDIGAFEYVNPLADTDHDGVPDWAELIAGTDPTDPNSVLKLQVGRAAPGTGAVLSWPSVSGRTYRVEFNSALTSGNWQTLTNNIQGTGGLLQISDALTGNSTRFYRLGVTKN